MPEKMKICPNCNNELNRNNWEHCECYDNWYIREEEWFCKCPHCTKKIWVTLPYRLEENNINFEVDD